MTLFPLESFLHLFYTSLISHKHLSLLLSGALITLAHLFSRLSAPALVMQTAERGLSASVHNLK